MNTIFKRSLILAASIAPFVVAGQAVANDHSAGKGTYLLLTYGFYKADDSNNEGSFPGGFTTGAGTSVLAGTALPAGTGVQWNTEFDSGNAISIAFGKQFDGFRGEVELSRTSADVDTHSGVTVADSLAIDGEDAGILITGSDNLGASVGAIVSDGQGSLEATYLMANIYADAPAVGPVEPFFGVGIGVADVDVEYKPSNVGIIDDSDTVFAYQVLAGADVRISDNVSLTGQFRFRQTRDVEVQASLFPATLEIQNKSSSFDLGVRYKF